MTVTERFRCWFGLRVYAVVLPDTIVVPGTIPRPDKVDPAGIEAELLKVSAVPMKLPVRLDTTLVTGMTLIEMFVRERAGLTVCVVDVTLATEIVVFSGTPAPTIDAPVARGMVSFKVSVFPIRFPVTVVVTGLGVTVMDSMVMSGCSREITYDVPLPETIAVPGKIRAAAGTGVTVIVRDERVCDSETKYAFPPSPSPVADTIFVFSVMSPPVRTAPAGSIANELYVSTVRVIPSVVLVAILPVTV